MSADIQQIQPSTAATRQVAILLVQAEEQWQQLESQLREVESLQREVLELHASIIPWEDQQTKQPIWDSQDRLDLAEERLERCIEELIGSLERAIKLDPDNRTVRRRLADLYWKLLCRAEERKDTAAQQRYASHLRDHDDGGRYVDLLEGTATLQLETEPHGARVRLYRLQTKNRRLCPTDCQDLGTTPVDPVDLAPGRYVLDIQLKSHAPTRRPIIVQRGDDLQVRVRLFGHRQVGPDFVYVPAGRFIMGGDPEAPGAGPSTGVFVDNVSIARHPVTLGEYMLFLDDLATACPAQALRYTPQVNAPTRSSRDPRLPVTGISFEASQAYCSWLSSRTGIEHRLPTQAEWEKACRGVDGRPFPWGDAFDPSFCHMRRSIAGPPRLLPVGSMTADESVYGARDMAGGVSEWTLDAYDASDQLRVIRGGSYCDGAESCRAACRLPSPPTAHPNVGFRLARPLPPGGGDRILPASVPASWSESSVIPLRTPRKSIDRAMGQMLSMASRLASSDNPSHLLPQLLCETVQLVRAERGMLVRRQGRRLSVSASCSADGQPLPPSDQAFDAKIPLAALRQGRAIMLGQHPWPLLAIPLADKRTCLLLQRRFNRGSFCDADLLLAQTAADPLSLALRIGSGK